MDIMASWENLEIEEKEQKEEAEKTKDKKKEKELAEARSSRPKYNQLLYKAKLVLKTSDPDIMADPEAIRMIYLQAVRDVVTSRYPPQEKDITVLAALQLQATYGNYKEDTYNESWLLSKMEECMPLILLTKDKKLIPKMKKDEKTCKEWAVKIIAKYQKVNGFTAREAMLNYLDYVQEWVFYGATFFTVEQRQFKDYPTTLSFGITCEGALLMHPEKKVCLSVSLSFVFGFPFSLVLLRPISLFQLFPFHPFFSRLKNTHDEPTCISSFLISLVGLLPS
jgi:hypothetical protein